MEWGLAPGAWEVEWALLCPTYLKIPITVGSDTLGSHSYISIAPWM